MKNRILAVALMAVFGLFGLSAVPAQATPASDNPCKVEGFYVNPDEKDYEPTRTEAGFLFEGKDLIHHATSLDFPDVKTNTLSFKATVDGKVQGKMETSNPYSTINQNLDGKFWSTAMLNDQEGGQNKPVDNVADLIGKDVKPGKVKYSDISKVVSFGVGYVVETGSTTVTSITFHGTKYDFTCKIEPSPTTSPTVKPTTSPTVTASPTHSSPSATPTSVPTTTSPAPEPSTTTDVAMTPAGNNTDGGDLPVTGSTLIPTAVLIGFAMVAGGGALFYVTRRRRTTEI